MAKLKIHSSGSGIINNINIPSLILRRKLFIASVILNVIQLIAIIGVIYASHKGY